MLNMMTLTLQSPVKVRALRWSMLIVGCGVAAMVAGCAAGDDGKNLPPGEFASGAVLSNPVVATLDFWDPSGTVQVRTFQCDWSAPSHRPVAYCAVSADFALVGGGAEVKEGIGQPGAMLTDSFPGSDLQTWIAKSKDHVFSDIHSLRPYAIGIKLQGVSGDSLRAQMRVHDVVDGPAEHPSATIEVTEPGYILVGGGAATSWTQGQLLTSSRPLTPTSWQATSKDHGVVDYGSVFAYAISMPACPNGFGGCLAFTSFCSGGEPAGTGYDGMGASMGDAMTTVGAYSDYSGGGRLLTQMIPNFVPGAQNWPGTQISFALSKDHQFVDNGWLGVCGISVRRG